MKARILLLCVLTLLSVANAARSQRAIAQTPALPFQSRLTLQGGGENAALTVHRDPLGKPCLKFESDLQGEHGQSDIYEHTVSINNGCSKPIKLRLCYYKSEHCTDVEVHGQKRKDIMLGVYPNMRIFRYSFQEKFERF